MVLGIMKFIHHQHMILQLLKTDYLILILLKLLHPQDGVFPYIIQKQETTKVIIVLMILIMVIL